MNWLDRLIGFFSPRTLLKRQQALAAVNEVRKYEGASRSRMTKNWHTYGTNANAEIQGALFNLRNRSRDLVRNNPYAQRGMGVIETNVVGKGIKGAIKNSRANRERQMNLLWRAWTESTDVDFDRKHNMAGLQKLVMRSIVESGEVIVRKRLNPGGQFPYTLQVLESDHIATNHVTTDIATGNRIVQGIEIDPEGRVVAYHLYRNHPGSMLLEREGFALDIVRVPVSEICHIYRQDRPGQLRGVPWLAPCMIKLRDLDEFEQAQLVRQKIAACFSVFVQDLELPDINTQEDRDELGEKVSPGIIEYLPPGKTVSFANPPGVSGEYTSYHNSHLRSVATGLGISFESLTGDLSQVNFSSARMGFLEMNRNIDSWRQGLMNTMFGDRVFQWFLEGAELLGNQTQGTEIVWTAPRREMVDPTKEIPAKISAIRGGITSLSEVIREQGRDPEMHMNELKSDTELIDALGLILDTDPRNVQKNGAMQGEQSDEPEA